MVDAPDKLTKEWVRKAEILSEALPFMRRYTNEYVVIKYGGNAMVDPKAAKSFARDIVLLHQVGLHPIVVHGGGPQIAEMLEKLNIKTKFINGLRVTNEEAIDIIEMVLSGSINKRIVEAINAAGGFAVGISGKDGNLIQAERLKLEISNQESSHDLGLVGNPKKINTAILNSFQTSKIMPVIAPIGVGPEGETFNINADTVAGAIASALSAKRLYILTDVPGVLDKNNDLITDMTADQAQALIDDKIISGGMIPKIQTCIDAVSNGVGGAVIIDGRLNHAILVEIFSDGGAGTLIAPI